MILKNAARLILVLFLLPAMVWAKESLPKTTLTYAQRDNLELKMDIYSPEHADGHAKPCIIFVFGGGFKGGERDAQLYTDFFRYFSERGYLVTSIDYRLGLKEAKKGPSMFNQKPLIHSIEIAVEDLYTATRFLIDNSQKFNIDTEHIIISGSSAGAITVLHADYEKRNGKGTSSILPESFRYAGVISFAGAIYSTEGTPSYKQDPAPTLFFHGSGDKLVTYKSLRFFRKGMFGSKPLAKKFKESKYPYCFITMENIGHDVAEYPMTDYLPEVEQFIQNFVIDKKRQYIDVNIKDDNRKSTMTSSPKDYYK